MKNPETGAAEFCPGCPMAGKYCGEVVPDAVRASYAAGHEYYNYFEVILVDQDGLSTEIATTTSLSPRPASRDALGECSDFFQTDEGKKALVDRIARCSGVTSTYNRGYNVNCRAISHGALDALKNKAEEGKNG